MGTFKESIILLSDDGGKKLTLEALVDTGATYSWIPENFLQELGVNPTKKRKLQIADGRIIEREMGEIKIIVRNEETTTLVIFGDKNSETLLGAYSLEGLGFAVDPVHKTLVPAINYLLLFKHL